ncbi:hypothetical protein [Legionella sp. 31fI33]|uniref:hypothetical protein n=1 Tax=Legionella sp. 31fI33 TaxID=2886376 RepID=UPI001E30482C|nr:hypothetical protein [Legionella sp. 31fI33]MCC5016007.1 hypothetical protein [Legionella sp. 31fI33]
MTALREKTSKNPNQYKEIMNGVAGIFFNQTKQLDELYKAFKSDIRQQKREKTIEAFLAPFKSLKNSIKDKVSSLYHSITLKKQLREGKDFQDIAQSTHLDSVERSIKRSMDKLDARHHVLSPSQNELLQKKTLFDIEKFIKSTDYLNADEKTYALNTLQRAKTDRIKDGKSGRSILDSLTTMWLAAKDKAAYPASDTHNEDTLARCNLIAKNMALSDREYNLDNNGKDLGGESRHACRGGTINKIVESLEAIHPDVVIIRGTEILSDLANKEFINAVENLSDEEQVELYQGDEELMQSIQEIIRGKINEIDRDIFEGSVGANKINEWVDAVQYIEIPETNAIKQFKERQAPTATLSKEQAAGSESPPQKLLFKGNEITPRDIEAFNNAFEQTQKLPTGWNEEQISKRAVKIAFGEEIWEPEDNLESLADMLLTIRKDPQAIKQFKEQQAPTATLSKEQAAGSESPPQKLLFKGNEITPRDIEAFNNAFEQTQKIPTGWNEEQISKRAVKIVFGEEIWEPEDNLESLAAMLLTIRKDPQAINQLRGMESPEDKPLSSQSSTTHNQENITFAGQEITKDRISSFNFSFESIKKSPMAISQSWTDERIARVCIKGMFPESVWEPEGNIEQLTTIMLDARNKELEKNNPAVTLAENIEDTDKTENRENAETTETDKWQYSM